MTIERQPKKRFFGTAIFAVIIVMVGSCGVIKPYRQPADIGDKLYRDVATTDTATIANIPWKQLFSDTLLQSLIGEGINNNLDLKVAVARIKVAAANARQSKLALLPSVDADATAAYQRVPSTQFGFPEAYQLLYYFKARLIKGQCKPNW
jgi:multidrug efflux system outer membrane protein